MSGSTETFRPLLLNFSWAWGGLEMTTATIFRRLRARGVDARVVAQPDSPLARKVLEVGEPDRLVPVPARKYVDAQARRTIQGVLDEHDCNLLHTFWSSDLFHATRCVAGRKHVGLLHHLQMLPGHRRKDPLRRVLYRRIDRVLTITKQIEARTAALWPVRPERLKTLYYGLELDGPDREDGGRRAARERLGLATDGPLIGLVGQICELKGQRFLLEVFHQLRDELPEAQLAFVGAPVANEADYAEELQRRIVELGLSDRVHYLGFRDDVQDVFPAFDVFVLGSRQEAFGLVVIEAMFAGCAVVASNGGGVPEIIEDGVDGVLYPPRDEVALRGALLDVLRKPEAEVDAMRRRARATVERRFTAERFTDELLKSYGEVLDARGVAV